MKKSKFLIIGLATSFVLTNIVSSFAQKNTSLNIELIHDKAIVIDTHSDTLMHVMDSETKLPTNTLTSYKTKVDVEKMIQGGLDVEFFAAFSPGFPLTQDGEDIDYPQSNNRTLALLNILHYITDKNDNLDFALSVRDIENSVKKKNVVAVSSIEGAYGLNAENGVELIKQYYDLGVRTTGLAWSYSNAMCEGINNVYPNKKPSTGGLSQAGYDVVKEMNRLGMVVDVSHMNDESFWEVLQASSLPIMASHSGCRSIVDVERNLSDEQIRALAKKGGVVQVALYKDIIGEDPVTSKEVVNHIDHIVKLVGIDYVGIGSDFDGADMPIDIKDCTEISNITKELVNRGYSQKDINKILGENTLRVLNDNEKGRVYKDNGKKPYIKSSIEMSEQLNSNTEYISAKIDDKNGPKINKDSINVVIDGIKVPYEYNSKSKEILVELPQYLNKQFHVITFSVNTNNGKESRETKMFYLK